MSKTETTINPTQQEQRKLALWQILIEIIKAFKSTPAYEQLKEEVENLKEVLDDLSEEHEDTKKLLDDLITSTTVIKENINTMSAEELTVEIKKMEEVLNSQNREFKLKNELQQIYSDNTMLLRNEKGNLFVVNEDSVYSIALEEDMSKFKLSLEPDISEKDLEKNCEMIETDDLKDMQKKIAEAFRPQIENSDFIKSLREDLEKVKELQELKNQSIESLSELHKDQNGISSILLKDGTFCVVYEEKKEMITFETKDGNISAKFYTDCDLSDMNNPKPLGRSYDVGNWENDNGATKSTVRFNQSGTIKEMYSCEKVAEYFKMNGLSENAVKSFIREKEEVLQQFGRVNDKEKSKEIKDFVDYLRKELAPDYNVDYSDNDTTYINITNTKTGEELYVNYSDSVDASPVYSVPSNIAFKPSENEIAKMIEIDNKDDGYIKLKSLLDKNVEKYSQEKAEQERKAQAEKENQKKAEQKQEKKQPAWNNRSHNTESKEDIDIER